MIKVTALALFMALCNAEKDIEPQGPSRLLLQAGGFGQQPQYNPNQNMLYGCLMSGQTYQDCYEMMIQYQQYMQYYQQQPQPQPQPNPVVSPPAPAPLPANPVPLTPANPPATGSTPGASTGATPGVVTPPATGVTPGASPGVVSPPPPPINQVPAPPQAVPGLGVPGLGLPNPGLIVPGVPGLLTPPVTDINCGPLPPATLCANRNNGPTGARGLNGLPLGPLELGANTANNAKLYCDTPGACANSEINWNIRPNPATGVIRSINQLLFSEPGSGTNSIVNIKNFQGGNNVELSNLECGTGSCNGLTLNGWGISLNDVNCAVPSDCMGCIFRNMKTMPDMFCPDPYAADAPNNPNCAIEVTPCFGY